MTALDIKKQIKDLSLKLSKTKSPTCCKALKIKEQIADLQKTLQQKSDSYRQN
jgi:hypothetical protein